MKLYIVHVGYYDLTVGIYELHSNILVAAESPNDAKNNIKNRQVFQEKQMHIDGIQEITNVDGYEINLIPTTNPTKDTLFGYSDVKQMI